MWFRGRTVLSFVILAVVFGGAATYGLLRFVDDREMPAATAAGIRPASVQGLTDGELDKLDQMFKLIQDKYLYRANRDTLIDGALQGMLATLDDPYAIYKPAGEADDYSDALQGAFTGIGAALMLENGRIVVESALRGSPAERAGLRPKDVLLRLNGQTLEGLTLSEAIAQIRGPKGTKAKLTIRREGVAELIELELVRDRIDLETVDAELIDGEIGLLRINQFTYETAAQLKERLQELESQGMKSLVIDVRDNPGGVLQSVVEVSQLLIAQDKPIVQYVYKDDTRRMEYASNGLQAPKPYPITVLMNRGSASAAEILAGALRYSADATLVGEPTYGKGLVQVAYAEELGDGSLVKLTVSKWLLPDGTWVNEQGVTPDILIAQADYYSAYRLPKEKSLQYDELGEAIRNLQVILGGVGYPADRKDGYYSEQTREAVKAFQAAEGLAQTGVVDAVTAERLELALYARLHDEELDIQRQAAIEEARARLSEGR